MITQGDSGWNLLVALEGFSEWILPPLPPSPSCSK